MGSKEKKFPADDNVQDNMYHERQVKALCALHALNNLFQRQQTFTKKDLDQICDRLSPGTFINPHRSMLGLGNYDVNVLMAALQDKGYETIWFDKRKNVNRLVLQNIMGFILNTPSAFHFGPLRLALHCKHWIALRFLHGQYMNLDSKLTSPVAIGDEEKLIEFLHSELEDGKKELLLVVNRDVYDANTWQKGGFDDEKGQEEERLNQEGVSGNHNEDDGIILQKKEGTSDNNCDNSKNCAAQKESNDKRESLKNLHNSGVSVTSSCEDTINDKASQNKISDDCDRMTNR
ncbi:josephin-like protein [Elysia marginata]|uniref:Josephin-2 n=1 Tax=Elysia marginata TaxID=1093978 RepID=A0AAV4HMS9_9GAST|nr:josephin-like protein [Elysia marginata]